MAEATLDSIVRPFTVETVGSQQPPAFRAYRWHATSVAKRLLDAAPPGAFDEQGLPAYSHPNPLMRGLFWRRIEWVAQHLRSTVEPGARVLDFGCGMGVLLPLLRPWTDSLVGVDIDLRAAPIFLDACGIEDVSLKDPEEMATLEAHSFDRIIALDCLEHIENLEPVLDAFDRLLAPDGKIVVCGPTENRLYKIGRWLAGFDGHYHVRGIADIRRTFRRRYATRSLRTFHPLAPFFRIFEAQLPQLNARAALA